MKKFLVALLVLALVAPAMAVSLTGSDLGSGKMRISYNVPGGEVLRGVALKLSTTAGTATIAGTADVTAISSFFDVFIDYAFSVPSGFTVTPRVGHPLADPAAAGVLTGFPASTYSLSMGALDETGAQGGVTGTGVLCEIQYVGTGTATIKVEADTLRGGAVVGDAVTQPAAFDVVMNFAPPVCTLIGSPSVVKNTAAPAIATRVNSGRTESFLASGVTSSNPLHTIQYQFTWGDGVGPWGAAAQTHVYTYTAAATYNVTVQARCLEDSLLSAVSAPVALTSEPVKSTAAIYADWASFGRKDCWAFTRNCNGDADGKRQGTSTTGFKYVSSNDMTVLLAAWNINEPTRGVGMAGINVLLPTGDTINGICADFNRDRQGTSTTGFKRVSSNDFPKLLAYWNVNEPTRGPGVPSCFGTGHYHYMINP